MKAIVYEGGGAKAGFGVGVTKRMFELGILNDIELIVGTSAGGLLGAGASKYYKNFDVFENVWLSIKKNSDIYDGKIDIWGFMKLFFMTNFGKKECKSLLNQQGLYKILKEHFGGMKLKDFPIPLCLTGTDLTKGEKEIYYPNDVQEYDAVLMLKVTSGIPIVLQSQEINGRVKCDGGMFANGNVLDAIKLGATEIYFVRTSPEVSPINYFKNSIQFIAPAVVSALLDGYTKEMWEDIRRDYPNVKIHIIAPDKKLCDALDFTKTAETVKKGYLKAFRYFEELPNL